MTVGAVSLRGQRQLIDSFQGSHRDVSLHVQCARDMREMVGRDNARDSIMLSRCQITFHGFGKPPYSLSKLQSDLCILCLEPDASKHREACAHSATI